MCVFGDGTTRTTCCYTWHDRRPSLVQRIEWATDHPTVLVLVLMLVLLGKMLGQVSNNEVWVVRGAPEGQGRTVLLMPSCGSSVIIMESIAVTIAVIAVVVIRGGR